MESALTSLAEEWMDQCSMNRSSPSGKKWWASNRLHALFSQLLHEHTEPVRLGVAVAVGVIVGCSPFFGVHFWIGLLLSLIFRLNKVAVFFGSQISIPPLAPLIGFASVQIGSLTLKGHWLLIQLEDFSRASLSSMLQTFFVDWIVGGVILGAIIALPAFGLTVALAQSRKRRSSMTLSALPSTKLANATVPMPSNPKPPKRLVPEDGTRDEEPWKMSVQRVKALYHKAPVSHRCYIGAKLAMDPAYRTISELVGEVDTMIDLGTGLAVLPALLLLRGQARRAVGVDWDAHKLQSARLALGTLPQLSLIHADIRQSELPKADVIVLMDVLHYYSIDEQRRLLRRLAAVLNPQGCLIIRETNRHARSWVTQKIEALAVHWGWNKGPSLVFRSVAELQAELAELGMKCEEQAASSWVHRGNILIRARFIS